MSEHQPAPRIRTMATHSARDYLGHGQAKSASAPDDERADRTPVISGPTVLRWCAACRRPKRKVSLPRRDRVLHQNPDERRNMNDRRRKFSPRPRCSKNQRHAPHHSTLVSRSSAGPHPGPDFFRARTCPNPGFRCAVRFHRLPAVDHDLRAAVLFSHCSRPTRGSEPLSPTPDARRHFPITNSPTASRRAESITPPRPHLPFLAADPPMIPPP